MTEESIKKQNKGQFKKKNLQLETADTTPEEQVITKHAEKSFIQEGTILRSSNNSEELEYIEKSLTVQEKPKVDMSGLIRDLMFNKYFHIMEKEARPIAEKMVSDGASSLHEVRWFLAHFERVALAKELAEKYGLS